ncbi:scopoletin glucosyltransferase-like [Amaranthus tricolor]|uniref:scopoletin glucosyltransferase-like n=1 Tax=Amaranthus tricolor TaxID=29722 RepID=UPI00258D31A0|nr:scopoletin glucosyltransferase-like [Amaranthus tricolor]
MGAEPQRLHIALFPLMAAGHMIPILDIAKLFSSYNLKTTIITTPLNASFFTKPLQNSKHNIGIEIIPFPSKEMGLPEGIENFDQFTSDEMSIKFLNATQQLQHSLEQVLLKCKPNCLVSDMLFPFSVDVAAKFNIPRVVFHGTNYFSQCLTHAMIKYEPYKSVLSNEEEFVIPNLPHQILHTKSRLPSIMRGEKRDHDEDDQSGEFMKVFVQALEAEEKSYGIIVNSFYELEPDYAEHYRKVMGRKAWSIGPVSMCNREIEDKFQRGKDSGIGSHLCLEWLGSRKPNSVVYVCFGSLAEVSSLQLYQIALGLEASGYDFIWVVRRGSGVDEEGEEEWLPLGFEKRMEGKGLIIKGWAPQMLILDHEAVGAFVTHCGWNSTLEGISCGVPLVTWPVFAEQFYNEILVTQVLKIGISTGAKEWNRKVEGVIVKWEDIKEVIRRIMMGDEALEIRSRANKVKELARKAIEVGGSSYVNMCSLIQELSTYDVTTKTRALVLEEELQSNVALG